MPEIGVCDFASVAMQPGNRRVRADRRRPGADDHASGQPGELVRLLRGVRPAGDPQADGRAALHTRRRQGGGGARDDVGLGPAAAGPGHGQLHPVRPRQVDCPEATARTCWPIWPAPTRWSSCPSRPIRRGGRAAGRLAARRVAGLSRWRSPPAAPERARRRADGRRVGRSRSPLLPATAAGTVLLSPGGRRGAALPDGPCPRATRLRWPGSPASRRPRDPGPDPALPSTGHQWRGRRASV